MRDYPIISSLAFWSLLCVLACISFVFITKQQNKLRLAKIHQMTCKKLKDFQAAIKVKREEYMGYLIQSLVILRQSHRNPEIPLTNEDRIEIVNLCLRQAIPLQIGLWEPTKKVKANLREIIYKVIPLFAEKIAALKIKLEIDIPPKIKPIIPGEPVFLEIILANVIGKTIYRLRKEGTVQISLHKKRGRLHLNIQDNGYISGAVAEKLITESVDFFLSSSAFQETCLNNAIGYSTSYLPKIGMNITQLTFYEERDDIANRNIEDICSDV